MSNLASFRFFYPDSVGRHFTTAPSVDPTICEVLYIPGGCPGFWTIRISIIQRCGKKNAHLRMVLTAANLCIVYGDQGHYSFRSQQNINFLRCRSSDYSHPWFLFTTHVPLYPSLAIWYPSFALTSDVFQKLPDNKKKHPEFNPSHISYTHTRLVTERKATKGRKEKSRVNPWGSNKVTSFKPARRKVDR